MIAPFRQNLTPRTKPPGPTRRKLLGSLMEIRKDRIRFVTEATQIYGDIVSFTMGPRRLYLLRHPDHVRHVLVENHHNYRKGLGLEESKRWLGTGLLTSEGTEWAKQRKQLAPLFREDRIFSYATTILESAQRRFDRWELAEAMPLDVARELLLLAVEAVGQTILNCDLEPYSAAIADDMATLTADAMNRMTAVLRLPWNSIGRRARRAHSAAKRLKQLADDVILPELLSHRSPLSEIFQNAGWSRNSLRDQVITLLLTGHETTAATVSWACHLLSQNAEVEHRLHDEIEEVLQSREPTPADLSNLSYARMVLSETMRLYPAVWLLPRRSVGSDCIGGYHIPAKSDVLISVYSMHRHPAFWSSPDSFLPERFAAGSACRSRAASYLPFGAGPRTCIGQQLAMLEPTVLLVAMVQRFRLVPVADRQVQPEASLTLHPASGVWLEPQSRRCSARPVVGKRGEDSACMPELGSACAGLRRRPIEETFP
jgi:enediyne biosynthesis protein E7